MCFSGGREEGCDDTIPEEILVGFCDDFAIEELPASLGHSGYIFGIRNLVALPWTCRLCLQFPETEHQDRYILRHLHIPHDSGQCPYDLRSVP